MAKCFFHVGENGSKAIAYFQSYTVLFHDSPMADFQLPITTLITTRNTHENFKQPTGQAFRNKRDQKLLSPRWRCDLREIKLSAQMLLEEKQKGHPIRVVWYQCPRVENSFGKCQIHLQLYLLPKSESTVIAGMEEHTRGSNRKQNRLQQEQTRVQSILFFYYVFLQCSIMGD